MADYILKNNREEIWLSIASLIRQLSTYASTIYYGDDETDCRECVQYAYDQIKDRKGVMYKVAFVKSTDAEYPRIMAEIEQQKTDAKLTELNI